MKRNWLRMEAAILAAILLLTAPETVPTLAAEVTAGNVGEAAVVTADSGTVTAVTESETTEEETPEMEVTESETPEEEALITETTTVLLDSGLSVSYVGSNKITVLPGESATLEITATTDAGDLTYQWYEYAHHYTSDHDYYSSEELEGETEAKFTIESVTGNKSYYCIVNDGYDSDTMWFYISVDSGLSVSYEKSSVTVTPGEDVTLGVTATTNYGEVTYQWYTSTSAIEDATEASYTIKDITESGSYRCMVSDDYNSETVYFNIKVDSGLTVSDSSVTAIMGGEVTLEVEATTNYGSLTYQWKDPDGNAIDGATEKSYTVTDIAENEIYSCTVSDDYNSETAHFYITVESGLSVSYEGSVTVTPGGEITLEVEATTNYGELTYQWYDPDSMMIDDATGKSYTVTNVERRETYYCIVSDGYETEIAYFVITLESSGLSVSYEEDVTAMPEEDVTLEVIATTDYGVLTYQWYESVYDSDYGKSYYEEIDGATEATYTVANCTESGTYYCLVSDGYETEKAYFSIMVESGLSTGDNQYVTVTPGEDVTLKVTATTNYGDLTYQWYKGTTNPVYGNYYYQKIDGATETDYTITDIAESGTYYCFVSDGCETAETYFYITVDSGLSVSYVYDVTVTPEEDATLKVEATTNYGSLTYQWYELVYLSEYGYSVYQEIDGATEAMYTVTDITEQEKYRCTVSDGYETESAYFCITVDSGLSVKDEEELTVTLGEEVTLTVTATTGYGSLTYQWYDNDWNMIDGATEATYTIANCTESGTYYCIVSDGYETESVYFYITVESGFRVSYERNVTVTPGEDVTLEVEATTNIGSLTYRWYDNDGNMIDGAAEATYTVANCTESGTYYCIVSDGYETEKAYFSITLDSGFSVSYNSYVTVAPGEDTTLEVTATTSAGVLTYQWYYGYQEISGATGATYTVEDITETEVYRCTVSDGYNTETITFHIAVSSGLSVTYDGNVTVTPGEDVTLEVEAATGYGSLTYQWYEFAYESAYGTYYEEIDGATEATYTIADITESGTYYCVVSDGYSSQTLFFYVTVDSGFSVSYEEDVTAELAGEVTLEVEATTGYGSLMYQWYDNDGNMIDGATEAAYTLTDITESGTYYCLVSDGYHSETAYFYITVDSGFCADCVGDSRITVKAGESATLEVEATTGVGQLTYQWYYNEYNMIEGATGASYTVTDITSYQNYFCYVSDGYNETRVWFYISVDTGLRISYQSRVTVAPGESAALTVTATTDYGELTYLWYDSSMNEIEGVTGATYTVEDITESKTYRCLVSDGCNVQTAYFYITLDSGFSVNSVGSSSVSVEFGGSATLEIEATTSVGTLTYQWYDDSGNEIEGATGTTCEVTNVTESLTYYCLVSNGYESISFVFSISVNSGLSISYDSNVAVAPGESATLTVTATTDYGPLTYQWYEYVYDSDNDYYCYQKIDGATEASYTVTDITEDQRYRCYVSDSYNSESAIFYITLDSGFSASCVGDSNITVELGGSATLEVTATTSAGELTYQWYDDEYNLIEGVTGTTCEVTDITGYVEYHCYVSDGYNSANVWFSISVNSGLSVSRVGDYSMAVEPGGSATLEVIATTNYGSLTYQWYNDDYEMIDGATGVSYTVTNITESEEYYCRVSDGYNSENVWFSVSVNSGLSVSRVGDYSVAVELGESATLEVTATTNYGPLTYQWYDLDYGMIDGATGASYTVTNITGTGTYRCHVSDAYNSVNIWFSVSVDETTTGGTSGSSTGTTTGGTSAGTTETDNGSDKPAEGTTFTVKKATYKATKAGSEVSFTGTTASGKVSIPATVKKDGITYKVTSIAANALKGNKKVTQVTIGKNVASIGNAAFSGCTKLKAVTVGAGVKTIGKQAFKGCLKLATITINSTKLTSVGKNAFKGIKSTAKIKVPAKKLTAYKKMLKGRGQGSKVKIVKK